MDFTFTPSLLGLEEDEASARTVRDLWKHTDNGTVAADGELTAVVGSQDVVMVTLTPA